MPEMIGLDVGQNIIVRHEEEDLIIREIWRDGAGWSSSQLAGSRFWASFPPGPPFMSHAIPFAACASIGVPACSVVWLLFLIRAAQ